MSDQPIYLFEREVSSVNLKVFNAILHLLHKIGKEIMIECNIDGHVCFQALNDTKSVFATIEFRDIFWNSHHIVSNESFQCKMSSKTVCSVFRNLKKVNGFVFYQIEESGDCFIVFKFHTSDGITKTHLIPYQDCDIINAIFDEESSHVLQTQPTVFTELFDHLHQSPEIIIHADSNTFTLRSHSSSSLGMGSKNLSTDLNVDISEFDVYQYRGNTFVPDHNDDDDDETEPPSSELLFVSKEFRALLAFCDVVGIPIVSIYFSEGGSPMKVKCDHTNMLFRIELVLATQQAPRKAHAPPTYRAVDRHVERGVPAGGQQANPTHNTPPSGHDENSSSSASNQRSSDGDEGVDFANYMEPGIVLASQSSTSLRKLQRNNNSQKRYVGSPVTEATYSQRTVGSEGHVVLNRVSKRHLRLLESQEEEEEEEEGNNNNVN